MSNRLRYLWAWLWCPRCNVGTCHERAVVGARLFSVYPVYWCRGHVVLPRVRSGRDRLPVDW